MKIRLAKKIWKARRNSLFPNPKKYWAVKWSNSQFYEGATYDHRIVKARDMMLRLIIMKNKNEEK